MANAEQKTSEPTENDIVFECKYCGKSLMIDYHGAGLIVQCPECKKDIQVPIPKGLELSDLNSRFRTTKITESKKGEAATTEHAAKEIEELAKQINIIQAASKQMNDICKKMTKNPSNAT